MEALPRPSLRSGRATRCARATGPPGAAPPPVGAKCSKEIFDTAPDPPTAGQQLAELRARIEALGLDFGKFWTTYDNWKTGILNQFEGRCTSAADGGIHHKARVITKRCYGVKSPDTLWNRLILDLNRAADVVARTLAEPGEMSRGPKAMSLALCP